MNQSKETVNQISTTQYLTLLVTSLVFTRGKHNVIKLRLQVKNSVKNRNKSEPYQQILLTFHINLTIITLLSSFNCPTLTKNSNIIFETAGTQFSPISNY